MKCFTPTLFLFLVLGFLPRDMTAQTIMLPPFTYTGRIVNYDNAGLADISSSAEIYARKNGKLIARSKICNVEGSVYNFSLSVPMASTASASTAMPGDRLTFEVFFGNKIYTATNSFAAVGSPGRVAFCNFMAATDSDSDGVADEYVNLIRGYMDEYGIAGAYDPHADYDSDGVSNYNEYLAGTDPFSEEDYLRFLSLLPVAENDEVFEATFLASKYRVYSVNDTQAAVTNGFTHAAFRTSKIKEAPDYDWFKTDSDGNGIRTIYLIRNGDSQLYRIRVE